jgi:TRAP-type mannitol/chloroaromatic compound transport system permease small subunit
MSVVREHSQWENSDDYGKNPFFFLSFFLIVVFVLLRPNQLSQGVKNLTVCTVGVVTATVKVERENCRLIVFTAFEEPLN